MERGGGHGFGGTCPHFFSIKNKNDVKSFHLDREESFRYHVFPVKSQLGEVLGPVLVARAPKNPPIFLLYRKILLLPCVPPRIFRPSAFPANATLYLAQCGHLWPDVALNYRNLTYPSLWKCGFGSYCIVASSNARY